MTTIGQAIQTASAQLDATSPTPRLDAQILLAHVLETDRVHVLAERDHVLMPDQISAYNDLIRRRAALEPIAYITGHKEFYGLDLLVDRRVLVPRPETELLVDLALGWARARSDPSIAIADIGTGSGAIALALAANLPRAHIFAIDLSPDALQVARANVELHGLTDQIMLLEGDGCAPLPQPVDLLVSNPPYTVLAEVDENVRRWEPALALDGGSDRGFAAVERLIEQTPVQLQPGGALLIEIGAWQGAIAELTARRVFPAARVTIRPDLAGHDRVLAIDTACPASSVGRRALENDGRVSG